MLEKLSTFTAGKSYFILSLRASAETLSHVSVLEFHSLAQAFIQVISGGGAILAHMLSFYCSETCCWLSQTQSHAF